MGRYFRWFHNISQGRIRTSDLPACPAMLNSGAGKFERAADLVAKFYAHKLVQSHNEFTIKCTECDFKIDPRILLFGGEQAIIKALDSFGKCGAAKMQAVFDDHKKAICCGIEECDCFKYLNRFC